MTKLEEAADAAEALDARAFAGEAEEMAAAFEAAGARIAASLEQAADSGKLSFEGMVEAVLKDLARLAVEELVAAPLAGMLDGLLGKVGGGKAAAQTINLNISGAADADGFRRSQGQIAASLARAVSAGRGRI